MQIQYLDKKGQLEKHEFEGTLKELHQKIAAEKTLPSRERAQLLRSLDLPLEGMEVTAMSFRVIPQQNDEYQSEGTY